MSRPLAAVRAVGLSGQMHGAVLLDARQQVLRPAILWNDTRAAAQCVQMTERMPSLPQVAGSEMSDAAGTLWLDVARRDWSDDLLALTGLTWSHMLALVEGSAVSATLSADVAQAWGLGARVSIARRR